MKKTIFVILESALLHLCVCLIEWFMWETGFIDCMSGFDGYSLYEKVFFLLLFALTVVSTFVLIRGETVIIDAVIFWLTFAFLDRIIGLRLLIAQVTNNEAYIYGPNWLGDDMWAACYIGCIVGCVVAVMKQYLVKFQFKA